MKNSENKGLIKSGDKFLAITSANNADSCNIPKLKGEFSNIMGIVGSPFCDKFNINMQYMPQVLDCKDGIDTVNIYSTNSSNIVFDLPNCTILANGSKISQIKNCEIFYIHGNYPITFIPNTDTLAIFGNNATTVSICPGQANNITLSDFILSHEYCSSGIEDNIFLGGMYVSNND